MPTYSQLEWFTPKEKTPEIGRVVLFIPIDKEELDVYGTGVICGNVSKSKHYCSFDLFIDYGECFYTCLDRVEKWAYV